VCGACEAGAFPLAPESYAFLLAALARPLADAPEASELAARQAERALGETVEHHAGIRWREAGPGTRRRPAAPAAG
jgi:DNA repair protein RecO (recombination protein O)